MDIRIANKFRLGRKIGSGSFGDIYSGRRSSVSGRMLVWGQKRPVARTLQSAGGVIRDDVMLIYSDVSFFTTAGNVLTGEDVAIKLEPIRARHPQLHSECKFYKSMHAGGRESGKPEMQKCKSFIFLI